jgi:hypothetical protein
MSGVIRHLIAQPVKHLYKLFSNPSYRQYHYLCSQLRGTPRYKEKQVKINNWRLIVPDVASFLYMFHEIFVEKIYQFEFPNDTPKILDLGSNIGLSILYFNQLYPKASIVGYEADPHIFSILQKNLDRNQISNL